MINVQRLKQSCQAQQNPDLKDGVILELIEMLELAEKESAENLKGALAWQQRAEAAVPAGWKLVPVEPTAQMLAAVDIGPKTYKALLAAAPEVE